MKQTIQVEIDIPEGFRYKGFGIPTSGDYLIRENGNMETFDEDELADVDVPELLFTKIGREPKDPDDVGKMVYVRDFEHDRWKQRRFVGIEDGDFATFDSEHSFATWQFAMIEEPAEPKYRPATADDVGKEVEFNDDEHTVWIPGVLGAYNSIRRFRYKSEETGLWWQHARVKV